MARTAQYQTTHVSFTHGLFRHAGLVVVGLLVAAVGCTDADPAAEMRAAFVELKDSTGKVDALLKAIDDAESARAAVPELETNLKRMREAGWIIEINKNIQSRKAMGLKNEIRDFREVRKTWYPEELRRLKNIRGVEDVIMPVLAKQGGEGPEASRPPGM